MSAASAAAAEPRTASPALSEASSDFELVVAPDKMRRWVHLAMDSRQLHVDAEVSAALCAAPAEPETTHAALTILGPARSGKSFLLNSLAGIEEFSETSSDLSSPCTEGIFVSPMPLPHSDIAPDGGAAAPTAVHVTLCDCEGLGDKDFSADAKLVASLLLTSKVVMFNWPGGLQKTTILSQLAVLANVAGQMVETEDSDGQPLFGHLHILLRDWAGSDARACEAARAALLDDEPEQGEQDTEVRLRNRTRRQLRSHFESVSVVALPPPRGSDSAADGSRIAFAQRSPAFLSSLAQLRATVAAQLAQPKRLCGMEVASVADFVGSVTSFCRSLNETDMIRPKSVLQTMLEAKLQHVLKAARAEYLAVLAAERKHLQQHEQQPKPRFELEEVFGAARARAVGQLEAAMAELALPCPDLYAEFCDDLDRETGQVLSECTLAMAEVISARAAALLEALLADTQGSIQPSLPMERSTIALAANRLLAVTFQQFQAEVSELSDDEANLCRHHDTWSRAIDRLVDQLDAESRSRQQAVAAKEAAAATATAELKLALATAERQVADLAREMAALHDELDTKTQDASAARQASQEHAERAEEARRALAAAQQKLQATAAALEAAEHTMADLREVADQHKARVAALLEDLEERAEESNAMRAEIEDLRQEMAAVEAGAASGGAQLQQELAEAQRREQELREQCQVLESMLATARAQQVEQDARVGAAASEQAELEDMAKKLKAKLASIVEVVKERTEEGEAMRAEVAHLRQALAAAEAAAADDSAKLQQEMAAVKRRDEDLVEQCRVLEGMLETARTQQAQQVEQDSMVGAAAQTEVLTLREVLAESAERSRLQEQRWAEERRALTDRVAAGDDRKAMLEVEIKELQQHCLSQVEELMGAKAQQDKAAKELRSVRNQLANTEAKLAELDKAHAASLSEVEDMRQGLSALHEAESMLRRELNQVLEARAAEQKQQKQQGKSEAETEAVAGMRRELRQLRQEAEETRRARDQLNRDKEALEAKVERLMAALHEGADSMGSAQRREFCQAEMQASLASAAAATRTTSAEMADLQLINQQLFSQVQEMEQEIFRLSGAGGAAKATAGGKGTACECKSCDKDKRKAAAAAEANPDRRATRLQRQIDGLQREGDKLRHQLRRQADELDEIRALAQAQAEENDDLRAQLSWARHDAQGGAVPRAH